MNLDSNIIIQRGDSSIEKRKCSLLVIIMVIYYEFTGFSFFVSKCISFFQILKSENCFSVDLFSKKKRNREKKKNQTFINLNIKNSMTLFLTYLFLCGVAFGLVTILYVGLKTIKLI